MPVNPSIPLGALLVTAGFVAAGFAAQASALDQRIEGFIDADPDAQLDVREATGQGEGRTIERVHLTVRTATSAPANLTQLAVSDDRGHALTVADVEPIRDEDGSLGHGELDDEDLARIVVDLAHPMEGNEVQGFVLEPSEGSATELVVETPAAIEDGYTRLDHDQRR